MFKQKRGDSAFIILILILIGIGILGTIISINVDFNKNDKSQWKKTKTIEKYDNVPNEDNSGIIANSQNNKLEVNQEGGGSGSGGDSSEASNQDGSSCITRLAKYSLTTIDSIQTCNEFDGEICLNKTISCSTNIANDDIVKVVFDMELLFVQSETNKEDNLKTQTAKYLLEPSQSIIMQGNLNINSEGESGVANQKINCFFNTIKDIEAEICT